MSEWPRRQWIKFASGIVLSTASLGRPAPASADAPGASGGGAATPDLTPAALDGQQPQAPPAAKAPPIALTDFEPRSVLRVPETRIERARHPVIDVHSHLTSSSGAEAVRHLEPAPANLLNVMDGVGLRVMVNLTGGRGQGLAESIQRYDRAHPGRFVSYTEPWWSRASEPGYAKFQADQIQAAQRAGARGLKVLKTLGLYLRESPPGSAPGGAAQGGTRPGGATSAPNAAPSGAPRGPLVKVDDPRFDPMWEACGALKMPVAIHVSDPEAFFTPIDRFNERYEELYHHPTWSFHGPGFPSFDEILTACDRVFARHPKTTFLALHVGHNAENLARVAERLDRFPNMIVELGARIGELGRQPRAARKFFDKYQDRILFGTDATPHGKEVPQQLFGEALYRIYYRFLETEDEYFDYAPAAVPPQGRWRIYGLGLPEGILKKVYHENAVRWLGLSL